ncbi:MAG: hypothetical protein ACJ75J_14225 [Cytophagaceae bacterium]
MKNKILLLALTFLCSTLSLAQNAQRDPLENTFVKENLSARDLQVFELRAQQKLKDYANYIEIISDKNFDAELRKEAAGSALRLFSGQDVTVHETLSGGKAKEWKLSDYLSKLNASAYKKIVSQISNLVLAKPMVKQAENSYKGELSYTQITKGYDDKGKEVFSVKAEKKAEVILKKVKKQFGRETEEVWEVFLGRIN